MSEGGPLGFESEVAAIKDGVQGGLLFVGEVVAEVGAAALLSRQGGGDHQFCDEGDIAGFDLGLRRHGRERWWGVGLQLGAGFLESSGVAEQAGVLPHEILHAFYTGFEIGDLSGGSGLLMASFH